MIIIRPISLADADDFERFALADTQGITSMPLSRDVLQKKVHAAVHSFTKEVSVPDDESYLFILEDIDKGVVGGTSGITAKIGIEIPEYFYKIETMAFHFPLFPHVNEVKILNPVFYSYGPSEIGTLFLEPDFRRGGLGRLLSLSRFLFIASHPNRFEKTLIAVMRCFINEQNQSPFWEGIGRRLFGLKFEELVMLLQKGKPFLPEIFLKHSLFPSLLPQDTQDAIGKVHLQTAPALKMLQEEGFQITDEVDFFDGGPKIAANTDEIRTIKENVLATVSSISNAAFESDSFIISNGRLDFRACYGNIQVHGDRSITIHSDVAEALKIKLGEHVRYVSSQPKNVKI